MLAFAAALGSGATAHAGFVPFNANEIGLTTNKDRPDDSSSGMSLAADRPVHEDPLSPANGNDAPRVDRDLLSLLGLVSGRGNQTGGAGSSSNSHDSGGYGQMLIALNFDLLNPASIVRRVAVDSDFSIPDTIVSRLFRPPRFSS